MIASLRGVLAEKDGGQCVVETGGVGYRVSVSSHTARALPEAGEAVFLHTHQVVREDALQPSASPSWKSDVSSSCSSR
jgi:Holliday junction DNA helicase RuvA